MELLYTFLCNIQLIYNYLKTKCLQKITWCKIILTGKTLRENAILQKFTLWNLIVLRLLMLLLLTSHWEPTKVIVLRLVHYGCLQECFTYRPMNKDSKVLSFLLFKYWREYFHSSLCSFWLFFINIKWNLMLQFK